MLDLQRQFYQLSKMTLPQPIWPRTLTSKVISSLFVTTFLTKEMIAI